MTQKNNVKKLVLSGAFIGIGLILPMMTMNIPKIGNMLCPMHIPVLLCGFICGGPYGLMVGFITPLLRSLIFGMPVMFPGAICMAFELSAYGFIAGILAARLKPTMANLYISLIVSMILGRVVWGVAAFIIYGLLGMEFTVQQFIAGGFINAVPGIIIQLMLIPGIVYRIRNDVSVRAFQEGTC